mmetsp:Transcript_1413/g.2708  ORF Transcript_1413/g.2708 Transcript_1413/m.2708 type:complete len:106 (-) Transcript_1413:50-367(-)
MQTHHPLLELHIPLQSVFGRESLKCLLKLLKHLIQNETLMIRDAVMTKAVMTAPTVTFLHFFLVYSSYTSETRWPCSRKQRALQIIPRESNTNFTFGSDLLFEVI